MKLEDYVGGLARCGWWTHCPAEAEETMRRRISAWYEAAEPGEDPPRSLLATVTLDPSGVEAEGLEAFIRTALAQLSAASGGRLQTADVTVTLDEEIESVAIAFGADGRRYRVQAPWEDEWLEEGLLDLVNAALERSGSPLRYRVIPSEDEVYHLAFVADEAVECAVAAGLIPEEVA